MFISSSISSSVEFWSVNYTSMYKIFLRYKYLGEMSSNSPNDLLGVNVYKTLLILIVKNITVD